MDQRKYLKRDLTTILILFIIFSGVFGLIYLINNRTGSLDVLASQFYEFLIK